MTRMHELRVGGTLPGPVIRIGAAVVVLGGTMLLNPFPLWCGIAAAAAVVAAILPRSMASWIGIACMPVGLLLTEPSPLRTALAVLLIPLSHVLAGWAWAVPWGSRVRVSVLLPGVLRLLVIQAIAQSVAAVLMLALPPLRGPGFVWLAPLGAAVLAGASAVLLRLATAAVPGAPAAAAPGGGPDPLR